MINVPMGARFFRFTDQAGKLAYINISAAKYLKNKFFSLQEADF